MSWGFINSDGSIELIDGAGYSLKRIRKDQFGGDRKTIILFDGVYFIIWKREDMARWYINFID